MNYSVLIIDDHPLFSRGLSQLIETQKDYKVTGIAKDHDEAMNMLNELSPDLAIVDLNLGQEDGLELIKDILAVKPQTKILVLSMHDERYYADRALKAGAKGYIMKEEAESNVSTAINTVMQGNIYLSEAEQKRHAELVQNKNVNKTSEPIDLVSTLSDRQLQIFTLLGKGLGTVEIAEKLKLSIKTIDTHKENMKEKLNCESATELRKMAIEWTSH
jgi:DNA-binding NarL/FixJ family response regulator